VQSMGGLYGVGIGESVIVEVCKNVSKIDNQRKVVRNSSIAFRIVGL